MKKMKFEMMMIIFMIIFVNIADAQDKYLLEYKYEKGKTYKYEQNSRFETVLEMSGQEMKNVGKTISVSQLVVNDVLSNGDQAVTLTYEDFRILTKMGSFDTTMVMKDMLGKGSSLLITKRGDVVESRKIMGADTTGDPGAEDLSSTDLSKELAEFPDHPVAMGDTWNEDRQDTASGTELVTRTKVKYLLAGAEQKGKHDCLKITFSGTVEISGKVNQMGMEFFMEGDGDVSGTLWYDNKAGILIAKENLAEQDITMAMTGQMQMTIPMTSTITGNFSLVE